MTKVLVTVSQATDGSFWCHTEDDVYGGGLNGAGASVKDAKQDLMECLEDAKLTMWITGTLPMRWSSIISMTSSHSSTTFRSSMSQRLPNVPASTLR